MAGISSAGFQEVSFLTGIGGGGTWHAISQESMAFLRTSDVDSVAFAECGELVRVAGKYGAYRRAAVPVTYGPCQPCTWRVAAIGGEAALRREVQFLAPSREDHSALRKAGMDPLLAVKICNAILDEAVALNEEDDDVASPAALQLLAAAAAHAPVVLVSEDCAEDDCEHPAGGCPAEVACQACSLRSGDWEGQFRRECTIPAPCGVLLALAKHAGTVT